jgi:hypothetical protein
MNNESIAPVNLRSPHPAWRPVVLWSGVLVLFAGLLLEHGWQMLSGPRVLETLVLSVLALAVAMLLQRLLHLALASALFLVFAAALIVLVGVLPVLAVLVLAGAGWSLAGAVSRDTSNGTAVALAGIGAIAGALGWLLPFPVHYRLVYFLLFAGLFAMRASYCRAALETGVARWRAAVAVAPRLAAFAVLLVGVASAGCWLPTVQFDDLAYHLGLPSQLAALGYYRMDVYSQVWALAPWSGDIVQAAAQLLAGAEARGAVDAFWLLAAATLTWQLAAALDTPAYARWLAVALFASLPLCSALVGGMQAELPASAISLALVLSVATAPQPAHWRRVILIALLAGFLLGLKAGFIVVVAPLGAWLAWRWRGQWSVRIVLAGIFTIAAVGGSSYVYAFVLTGNPLFPTLNGFFHSLLFSGQNLGDPRWAASVGADIVWQLTFHTRDYYEGWDGAAGFSLLGLSGALVLALVSPRLRPLALTALIASIAALVTVPYYRYAFPALVLMSLATVASVASVASRRHATALLVVLSVTNVACQSCAYWTLHTGGIKRALNLWDPQVAMEHFAPERLLIQTLRERDPGANVVFCSPAAPFAAELAGHGFVTAWYDPQLQRARQAAEGDASGGDWRDLFALADTRYVIDSDANLPAALAAALADAQLVQQIGSARLWKLPPGAPATDLMGERDLAARSLRR